MPEPLTYEQAAESLVTQIADAMKARGMTLWAFPARRCDEVGWRIGHVLNGTTMMHQVNFYLEIHRADIADDYVNCFLDTIQKYHPKQSARMTPSERRASFCIVEGLHLRFVMFPDNASIRCDALVG